MPSTFPAALRQDVIGRADGKCEYCHKPQVSFFPHEIDHIIAQKHGGSTTFDNLALACFECNRYKGSDIASIDPDTGQVTRLFNPRIQVWEEHFRFQRGEIIALSPEGRVTVLLLRLNDATRLQERIALNIGVHP